MQKLVIPCLILFFHNTILLNNTKYSPKVSQYFCFLHIQKNLPFMPIILTSPTCYTILHFNIMQLTFHSTFLVHPHAIYTTCVIESRTHTLCSDCTWSFTFSYKYHHPPSWYEIMTFVLCTVTSRTLDSMPSLHRL